MGPGLYVYIFVRLAFVSSYTLYCYTKYDMWIYCFWQIETCLGLGLLRLRLWLICHQPSLCIAFTQHLIAVGHSVLRHALQLWMVAKLSFQRRYDGGFSTIIVMIIRRSSFAHQLAMWDEGKLPHSTIIFNFRAKLDCRVVHTAYNIHTCNNMVTIRLCCSCRWKWSHTILRLLKLYILLNCMCKMRKLWK